MTGRRWFTLGAAALHAGACACRPRRPPPALRYRAGGHEWRVLRERGERFLDEIPAGTSAATADRAP